MIILLHWHTFIGKKMDLISSKSFCQIIGISSVTLWRWKRKNKIQIIKQRGTKCNFVKLDENLKQQLKEKILFKRRNYE